MKIDYYSGTTKAATEDGYEVLDASASAPGGFRDSVQSASKQGWRLGQRNKDDAAREEEYRASNPDWYID